MPITSQQMSGMIGGQQAMFGNFASYAQQISPGFQGNPPTYPNPMAGTGSGFAPPPMPLHNPATMAGPQTISALGNVGLPALGTAAMLGGSLLPGAAGRFMGSLDPFSAGLGGFARAAGLRSGGMGIMANMGRIASGGIGSVARAGLAGVGGAVAAAAPIYAASQAAQYGVGQMVQGAQFQNQVQGMLNQNFRFLNPQARSGYGFSREQGADIASMVREMGHSDMTTGPQELLRIMQSGTQQGLFRAVQDVKEFKKRFTDMVGSLKEVAKTMNTTLEGAMPFFSQARQMGFWTPNDISRHAQQARQAAGASGLSVAQTQQMMAQGAQMARSVGAMGYTGAQGMAQSMQLVGGGLRGGAISERDLSEATGGLMGPQAVQSLAGTLQSATTRFARSRRARWMLAAMGRNGFTSLDPGAMQDMMSGTMSLRDIGRGARKNISEQGRFNFVNNERELRGELIRQGPMAQLGFMRTMIGEHLYGDDERSKYITRRLMRRNFGVGGRQADVLANLARRAPQIMAQNEARGAAMADQSERDREQIMDRSWEGVKRKSSAWWDQNVKEPLQEYGANFSKSIGDFFEKVSDKLWGRVSARHRLRGISDLGMEALQRSAMGDTRIMEQTFGKAGDFEKEFGGIGTGLGPGGTLSGMKGGVLRSFRGREGGLGNAVANLFGMGTVSNDAMDAMLSMGASEYAFATEEKRDRAVREKGLIAGRYAGGGRESFRAFDRGEVDRIRSGLGAAVSGTVSSDRQANALGFSDVKSARSAIESARAETSSAEYLAGAAAIARKGKTGVELAKAQVAAIESGELGSPALRKYVRGGKTMAEKISRLSAAQSKEARAATGGIDLSKTAEDAGVGLFGNMEHLTEKVAEAVEAAEGDLAKAMGATKTESIAFVGSMEVFDPDALNKLGDDKRFRRAMMLMSSGESDEEIAENKEKAREMLLRMSSDKKHSPKEQELLKRMASGKDPGAERKMADVGKKYKAQERLKFAETAMRRSERLFNNLGDQREGFLATMDKIKAEGGDRSLGSLIRGLQGETDPAKYQEKLASIAELGGQAGEEQIARAAEALSGIGGGEHIVAALREGRNVRKFTEKLTGKFKKRGSTAAANALIGGLTSKTMSRKDVRRLMEGDENQSQEVIEKIVGGTQKENKERVKELLQSIQKGEMTDITANLTSQALVKAQERLSPSDVLRDKAKDLEGRIEVLGELGSNKGMHVEATRQTRLLQQISGALHEGLNVPYKSRTGNQSESPES